MPEKKPPGSINPALRHVRRPLPGPEAFVEALLAGNRTELSRAITLIESTLDRHREMAREIIDRCLPHSGRSVRIGITGTPGVGKSTFIEAFGNRLIGRGARPAVLAVDPSSQFSKGSVLGDKTRMGTLAVAPEAFIRPSPAGGSLGGVARKTRESIILCEAAGFDHIIVETVGVGQSETAVHSMVDFFLLLLQPGAGDELQGIKRGIVEMADLLAVNKADGDRLQAARNAQREYRNALHLFPAKRSGWSPRVLTCSALTGEGVDTVLDTISEYLAVARESGYFQRRRSEQATYWLRETIQQELINRFYNDAAVKARFAEIDQAVEHGKLSPFTGAEILLELFRKKNGF